MKHFLFTSIAFLLLSVAVQSQHINLGIKGGLNAYTILGNDNYAYKPKLSFNAGLLGHIHINSHFAIQPEVVYSRQGTTYKDADVDNALKLNYVNIPVIFQYMFDNGFRIQAGPQLGILTNANLVTGDTDTDLRADYKSTDFGVSVGMSYVKPLTGFGIDIRYNHGLTNINSTDAIKSYNSGVQLGIFFLFQHRN